MRRCNKPARKHLSTTVANLLWSEGYNTLEKLKKLDYQTLMHIFGIGENYYYAAKQLFAIAPLVFLSVMLYSFFKSILHAYLMYPLVSSVNVLRSIVKVVLGYFLVSSGYGVFAFFILLPNGKADGAAAGQ